VTLFEAGTHAEAVVLAPQQDIWDVLVDPDLVARFTPFVKRISADGAHWRWEMGGLEVLGKSVAPAFTERMVFTEPDRIEFHHDPPEGVKEKSWVEGWYDLAPVPDDQGGGTALVTDLTISLDLPLPGVARPAVKATMGKVIDTMGDRFSANLLAHLGAESRGFV
jgi:carbon monoxide dehydrogenase subunit G